MKTSNLNTDSIAHHLRIAAERYEEHARDMRDPSSPEPIANGREQLAQQFDRQALEARAYASAFDGIYSVGFADGGAIEVAHD